MWRVIFADVQQRLGRDAAPIEADAADLVAVEADDVLAELTQPNRGVVTARARADDDCVDVDGCHNSPRT